MVLHISIPRGSIVVEPGQCSTSSKRPERYVKSLPSGLSSESFGRLFEILGWARFWEPRCFDPPPMPMEWLSLALSVETVLSTAICSKSSFQVRTPGGSITYSPDVGRMHVFMIMS